MDRSLVITFTQPCQVVRWAPLHGGLGTGVSRVLVQRVLTAASAESFDRTLSDRTSRQARGKLGSARYGRLEASTVDLH